MNRSKIVAADAITAAGSNKFENLQNSIQKKTFASSDGFCYISDKTIDQLKQNTPDKFSKSKCMILSYSILSRVLHESGWSEEDLSNSGFIFASTTSQIDLWEKDLPNYQEDSQNPVTLTGAVFNQSIGSPLKYLSQHFNVNGPKTVISSSCSASLQALIMAHMWIQQGLVDRCIVGATEILSELTTVGFSSLRLIAKAPSLPFSKNRNGINLGDGCGFLLLERSSLYPSNHGLGYICSGSMNLDSYHPTSPHPEGEGSKRAMQDTLNLASVAPSEISWIYAHGTGSIANDLSEANAISSIFKHTPSVTSTKGVHGHTLAASGLIESIIGLSALKENIIVPNTNDDAFDASLNILTPSVPVQNHGHYMLKNSLGFGGVNASILFSKVDQLA